MNNQSFANPFGPNGSSALSSGQQNRQMHYSAQSFPQLVTNNNVNSNLNAVRAITQQQQRPTANRCNAQQRRFNVNNSANNNTIAPSSSYSNMPSSVSSIDLGAMLQNFGLLKSTNSMERHSAHRVNAHAHGNKANDISNILPNCTAQQSSANNNDIALDAAQNKELYDVLGQLTNFNANANKQRLFKSVNTVNNLNLNSSHNNNANNNTINNMISQLTIPQNRHRNRNQNHTQSQTQNATNNNANPSPQNRASLFPISQSNNTQLMDRRVAIHNNRTQDQTQPQTEGNDQAQNVNVNNPYFKNVANHHFGMNLNITSSSQQIPLVDMHKADASKPLLLLNDKADQKKNKRQTQAEKQSTKQMESTGNKTKHTIKVSKQIDRKQVTRTKHIAKKHDNGNESDASISSSSSSNVEQFLDSLKNEKKRKYKYHKKEREKRNKLKEPPLKKRKLNTSTSVHDVDSSDDSSDEFEYDLTDESDQKIITKYAAQLEKIKSDTLRTFGLSAIKREPFVFRKSIDLDVMYPHNVHSKLLKYEEELSKNATASQLLALYAENTATMRMYKAYINLPSVLPIALPVIDGKKVTSRMTHRPFIVENWRDLHCKFPSDCSYLDLLTKIGGTTKIRVIDNITNCEISEDMKLYQYLYSLSGTKPEQREYSMNLISLEISGSILDRHIVRPRFIQNMDWISPKRHCWFKSNNFRKYFFSTTNNLRGIVDNVENKNLFYIEDGIKTMEDDNHMHYNTNNSDGNDEDMDELEALKHSILSANVTQSGFPEIQKYVLISSANSFTEWNIDFNGSCVWYYIAKGMKYFYIMSPTTPLLLEQYRKWREQSSIRWFPEYAQCQTQLVIVKQNQLLVLPSGTIHCVYTPVDCVAFSGNWLSDENIQIQLRIEHLYHEIYSHKHVPCCQNFRDLNALRVCEYYYDTKVNNKKLRKRDKQNAIDLCIQMIFWLKEEREQRKKNRKDQRLCKFDLIDVHKLKPKVYETLAMFGCKTKLNIQSEMKRFLKKYPHYKPPSNAFESDDDDGDNDEDVDNASETQEDDERDDESDYDVNDERDIEIEAKINDDGEEDDDNESSEADDDEPMPSNARKRTLRSAKKQTKRNTNSRKVNKKRRKKRKTSRYSKKAPKTDKIQCFKCKEQSSRRHMILFVCCDTFYHLRCAGYTTTRTQRAIQQHIDNGTITKKCPFCVKMGRK